MRIGALSLASRRRFAEGGTTDEPMVPPQASQTAAVGALGQANQNSDWFPSFQQGVLGMPMSEVGGKLDALTQRRDAAAQEKMSRIQAARDVLTQAYGSQTTNLPLLAFGASMMAPTRTGSMFEAASRGIDQALPLVQQQRQKAMDYATAQGNLGVAGSDVELQMAQDSTNDFMKRLNMVQQAGTWGARTQGANDRNMLNNMTKLDIAAKGNELRQTLAGITDTRARDLAKENFFLKNQIFDETVRKNIESQSIAQQNADTNSRNADTRVKAITGMSPNQRAILAAKDPNFLTDQTGTLRKYGLSPDDYKSHAPPAVGTPPAAAKTAPTPLPDFSKPPPAAAAPSAEPAKNPFDFGL